MNIAVFISGRGSNLHAIIKQQKKQNYQVKCVISNNRQAAGLALLDSNIGKYCINWVKPDIAEKRTLELMQKHKVELIVLAGFMRLLSADFLHQLKRPVINIHPSLLPEFPGLNTHKRAIQAKKKQHGASVHLVNQNIDDGQVISQSVVTVLESDTLQTLANKVLKKEHKLLPHTIGLIARKNLVIKNNKVFFDGTLLKKTIIV